MKFALAGALITSCWDGALAVDALLRFKFLKKFIWAFLG